MTGGVDVMEPSVLCPEGVSLSLVDLAISASREACNASSCEAGKGDRGERAGRAPEDRPDESSSCTVFSSAVRGSEASLDTDIWSNERADSCNFKALRRA